MTRRLALLVVALVVACGCATTIEGNPRASDGTPATTSAPPDASWIASVIPDITELSRVFNTSADDVDPLVGDASDLRDTMLGDEVSDDRCISAIAPLEHRTFDRAPVHEVAYATLPDATFGAVALPSAQSARSLFDTLVGQWRACDGRTVVLASRNFTYIEAVSSVDAKPDFVSAVVVMTAESTGMRIQTARALGVAENCIIDVELRTPISALAVALTQMMMAKVPALQ
ncbi:sensor domain-containing protein [Mycobacterium sp. MBM]|nr:sensor domain-containing protein [Mycobacterium sp. MBM]